MFSYEIQNKEESFHLHPRASHENLIFKFKHIHNNNDHRKAGKYEKEDTTTHKKIKCTFVAKTIDYQDEVR